MDNRPTDACEKNSLVKIRTRGIRSVQVLIGEHQSRGKNNGNLNSSRDRSYVNGRQRTSELLMDKVQPGWWKTCGSLFGEAGAIRYLIGSLPAQTLTYDGTRIEEARRNDTNQNG